MHTNVASYDIAVGPAVLYSDLSSNSPLEGPRVICTAILSKTFLSESTDCRVSALSSFIFQEGCKSHIHMSDLTRTPANVELQLRHEQTDLTQLGDSLTLRSNSWKSSLSSCSVSSLTWFAFASLASVCKKTRPCSVQPLHYCSLSLAHGFCSLAATGSSSQEMLRLIMHQ